MRPGRVKGAPAREEATEPVADADRLAEPAADAEWPAGPGPVPGVDNLAPVLDEEILEPKACIR